MVKGKLRSLKQMKVVEENQQSRLIPNSEVQVQRRIQKISMGQQTEFLYRAVA